ncbi:cation diffusion facilitator family transporter [Aquisalimonas asiatica]|nr:cation diffusion facilitator family transporter [Aquisalimonas asiatica]
MIKTERGALGLSAAMALALGVLGLVIAFVSGSQAIMLDGLFNVSYFVIALATVRVARLAEMPDSGTFPFGYGYFESLINAGKGLLILGISALALGDSLIALATGGREVAAGLAITYAAIATTACGATAMTLRRLEKRLASPLVTADVGNWAVNTAVSAAVLLAFCLIPLLHWLELPRFTPYIDPLLVTLIVILCIGVPVRIAARAIMELLNRSPAEAVRQPVQTQVEAAVAGLPVDELHVRMVHPGRTLYVLVHVVLPADYRPDSLAALDAVRRDVSQAVRSVARKSIVDVVFTGDAAWAQPWPPGGWPADHPEH